jgi:hypothetical protein
VINYLNNCLNQHQKPNGARIPFTNKFSAGTSASGMTYSPYKAYATENDMATSMKYSTSINLDKYKQYTQGENNAPMSYSKTLGNTFNEKGQTAEFDHGYNKGTSLSGVYDNSKENLDYSNRSIHTGTPLTTYKTQHGGNDFGSTSMDGGSHARNIQPIKYHDPHK